MTIEKAIETFDNLKNNTSRKVEIKIFRDFQTILSNLLERNLTNKQLEKVESQLEKIDFSPHKKSTARHFSIQLSNFKTFLKSELSLITKGYYVGIGLAIGMSLGMSIGIGFMSLIGISLSMIGGMIVGMIIGMAIGQTMDKKAEDENRVLDIQSY
ncbi:hypothetical protein ABN763_13690 [Spongiivirga sp. MCCC 1A20706]|uniref:hypothetical protein n=1 Tax=Spongiivirga sp. MCCC 1A20706 TaxID=3160963 RepID=UPI0039778EC8